MLLQELTPLGPDVGQKSAPHHRENSDGANISLGSRLLRVTPEDAFELQPCIGPRGETLVADLRLDNRSELASRLGIPPADLSALPDSALLLSAWLRLGKECLQHLRGAFAFAVWDPLARQLFLARDHSGERNLYYRASPDSLLFATTARAIRRCPGVSSELDEAQLVRDLVGLPPQYPSTRFRELRQIAPGHCVTVTPHAAKHKRYWDIFHLRPTRLASDREYSDQFRELFDDAVRCRLRSNGPIASELSAGLDSSAVTATAAHLLAQSGTSLDAYTAVPRPEFGGPIPPYTIANEGPAAAEVARLYPNIRHHLVDATGSNMLRELERNFPLLDLPHAAALNAVWSNLIYDHARSSGVRVMLSGALGNFAASYDGADILATLFRQGRLITTFRTAARLRAIGISSIRNAASLTLFASLPWALRHRIDPLIRSTSVNWSPLARDLAKEHQARDQFRRYLFLNPTALPRLMATQFLNNQYGDYNAAALAGWQIEVRDPTADRRLFEFCASIPPEQYLVGNQSRSLIRRAMRDRLPASTLNRKEKGIQAADWYENLSPIRTELAAELEHIAQDPTARRLLNLDMLRRMLTHWPPNAQDAWSSTEPIDSAIYRGVAVGYFVRRIHSEHR